MINLHCYAFQDKPADSYAFHDKPAQAVPTTCWYRSLTPCLPRGTNIYHCTHLDQCWSSKNSTISWYRYLPLYLPPYITGGIHTTVHTKIQAGLERTLPPAGRYSPPYLPYITRGTYIYHCIHLVQAGLERTLPHVGTDLYHNIYHCTLPVVQTFTTVHIPRSMLVLRELYHMLVQIFTTIFTTVHYQRYRHHHCTHT